MFPAVHDTRIEFRVIALAVGVPGAVYGSVVWFADALHALSWLSVPTAFTRK